MKLGSGQAIGFLTPFREARTIHSVEQARRHVAQAEEIRQWLIERL